MSRNGNLFSKENWQNMGMCPGPSNLTGLSIPTTLSTGTIRSQTVKTAKQTWTCSVCKKELSSKRSYTEHMNIHNKARPFRCDNCTYAAASQMTLHRHKLRNHTPKTEWGYRCPYCEDAYMEPAGYQQHVQQRHTGKSATYGCPFRVCKFTSKSQRHFREHLVKHDRNDKIEGGVDPCALSNQQLVRYMVHDEIGLGFERSVASSIIGQKMNRPPVGIAPKMYVVPNGKSQNGQRKMIWQMDKRAVRSEITRIPPAPPRSHIRAPSSSQTIRYYVPSAAPALSEMPSDQYFRTEPLPQTYDEIPTEFEIDVAEESDFGDMMDAEMEEDNPDDDYDEGPPVLDRQEEDVVPDAFRTDWVENEIEIATNDVEVFPNGFIDDELD